MPETTASQYAEKLKDSAPMVACETVELDQESPWSLYPSSSDAAASWFFIPPGSTEIYQVSVQKLTDPYLLYILGSSYSCGNCESRLPQPDAHAPCGHGYMTGCEECGDAYHGGYNIASEPDSGPPCQVFVSEMEKSILAGSTEYTEEYKACRTRWSEILIFSSELA